MTKPEKHPEAEGNVGSPQTSTEETRPWTQEEMEEAEPCPMPEVPDQTLPDDSQVDSPLPDLPGTRPGGQAEVED